MILLLKLWLIYHTLLALVAIIQRAPLAWWQQLPCGAAVKRWLCRRLWVFVDRQDGWLGAYWNRDHRKLYLLLCPWLGVRLDVGRRPGDPEGLRFFRLLWGEIQAEDRIKALGNGELGRVLCDQVWAKFALGTEPSILVGEAMDRLRSLPDANSGAVRIARERLRQIQEEGFTAERDAQYTLGQLTDAAMCYNLAGDGIELRGWTVEQARAEMLAFCWPWSADWCKPKPSPSANYAIAGALIAAEIDRLERLNEVCGIGRWPRVENPPPPPPRPEGRATPR